MHGKKPACAVSACAGFLRFKGGDFVMGEVGIWKTNMLGHVCYDLRAADSVMGKNMLSHVF